MEYGTRTRIAIVNRNESLRVRPVIENFVAIVGLDNLGQGTGDITAGRNERQCKNAEMNQVSGG